MKRCTGYANTPTDRTANQSRYDAGSAGFAGGDPRFYEPHAEADDWTVTALIGGGT